jgi:hypothetical protein
MPKRRNLIHTTVVPLHQDAGEAAGLPAIRVLRFRRPGTVTTRGAGALAGLVAGAILLWALLPTAIEAGTGQGRPPGPQAGDTLARRDSAEAANVWININGGGAFTSIGAGPTGIILAGSDLGGACRSKDRGRTWDVIGWFRGMPVPHVTIVAFDPRDGNVMYIGTEAGIYRSGDSGDRFAQVLPSGYIGAIAAAPGNPSIVYAGWHPRFNATEAIVYKSTDRGQSWKSVSSSSWTH